MTHICLLPGDIAERLKKLIERDVKVETTLRDSECEAVQDAIELLESGVLQRDLGEREAWDRYVAGLFSDSEWDTDAVFRLADRALRERRARFGGGK